MWTQDEEKENREAEWRVIKQEVHVHENDISCFLAGAKCMAMEFNPSSEHGTGRTWEGKTS